MIKYNWTLTVDVLNEEDIITDILCQGLICHGITKFSDLKGEKAGLPMYLREQTLYLEFFLKVVIACDGRNNSEEKWEKLLPENLSMILNHVWRCFDTKTKALMGQRFTSPYGFLFSFFKDEERIFQEFGDIESKDHHAFRLGVFNTLASLRTYCSCFLDCVYFSRYISKVAENLPAEWRNLDPVKLCDASYATQLVTEKSYNALMGTLTVRAINVLKSNKIAHMHAFVSWCEENSSSNFLNLKNCGKKSAIELELFREKVIRLLTRVGASLSAGPDSRGLGKAPSADGQEDSSKALWYLVRRMEGWDSNEAKDWITKKYGQPQDFCVAFMNSPEEVYDHIQTDYKHCAYELCMQLIAFLALAAIECKDVRIGQEIEARVRLFLRGLRRDWQDLEKYMLLSEERQECIVIKFDDLCGELTVGCLSFLRNVVRPRSADSIIYFILQQHNFFLFNGIRERDARELTCLHEKARTMVMHILFGDNKDAKHDVIRSTYPFLDDDGVMFVDAFNEKYGHYPMFFIAKHFFESSNDQKTQMYRDYYGIGGDQRKSLEKLAAESHFSRERVRQLMTTSNVWVHYARYLFSDEVFSAYPFIFDDFFTKESSDYQHLIEIEKADLTFLAFCAISRLVSAQAIKSYGNDIYVVCSWHFGGFSFDGALTQIRRRASLKRCVDEKLPIYDTFVDNEKYWTSLGPDKIKMDEEDLNHIGQMLAYIAKSLGICDADDKGNLILKANKLNYADLVYSILQANGSPMHIHEIYKEISSRYPNDSRVTESIIRTAIKKDDRIEGIGRSATYKLKAWGGYTGSISALLDMLVSRKNHPVEVKALAKEALIYRPDSNVKSIMTVISQKVKAGTLCMLHPNLVGMAVAGIDYD